MGFSGAVVIMAVILVVLTFFGIKYEGSRDDERSGKISGILMLILGAMSVLLIPMVVNRIYGLEIWMGYFAIIVTLYFLTIAISTAATSTVAYFTDSYSFCTVFRENFSGLSGLLGGLAFLFCLFIFEIK